MESGTPAGGSGRNHLGLGLRIWGGHAAGSAILIDCRPQNQGVHGIAVRFRLFPCFQEEDNGALTGAHSICALIEGVGTVGRRFDGERIARRRREQDHFGAAHQGRRTF